MSQLKPSFVREIQASLESSKFTANDFSIALPESGKELLKIKFLYKPEYSFTVYEELRTDSVTVSQQLLMSSRVEETKEIVYVVRSAPGQFKVVSTQDIGHLGGVLEEIKEWCENVRADLYAISPKHDPWQELREQLQSKVEEMVQDPDAYFSEDELTIVDKRLDQFYSDFANLREELELTKKQLTEVQAEVTEFKNSARVYQKGIWAKITGNKIIQTTGKMFNTPEGRAFLFQQAKKLLGQSE